MAFYVLYKSRASAPSEVGRDVLNILRVAVPKNRSIGLTGFLHYQQGRFFQYIEGERDAVERLFDEIAQDPRHHDVRRIATGQTEQRRFADFEMGFASGHGMELEMPDTQEDNSIEEERIVGFMLKARNEMRER